MNPYIPFGILALSYLVVAIAWIVVSGIGWIVTAIAILNDSTPKLDRQLHQIFTDILASL